MFKKVGGGKYSLLEVLSELYKIGDYQNSDIAQRVLNQIQHIRESRIRSVILNNVPKRVQFKTKNDELDLICAYVKIRLDLLKQVLHKLSKIT